MNFVALPVGSAHGWGVCGKYLSREMAALAPGQLRLLTTPFTAQDIGDELEFQAITALQLRNEDLAGAPTIDQVTRLPGPLLACIVDKRLLPNWPQIRGTRTVGYTFFEENIFDPSWIENARRNFERVATGSTWCTDTLRTHGLANVETVVQGIDPRIFFPMPDTAAPAREFLRDRFVIFSGGKFELRKGQDIVMRAVKIMQDRHNDVVLVNAWFNPWQTSIDTMRNSPHVRWPAQGVAGAAYMESMSRLLAENGLDLSRVITLAPRPNAMMARIYRNSDVAIFPNRCEGGTNLVLMEYMACGKPVAATASTGHADIIHAGNALVVETQGERIISEGSVAVARWPEPVLDDAVAKLEWAYQHREALAVLGRQAGGDLSQFTWTRSAEAFLKLLS